MEHIQTFRSKMASKAEAFAKRYELSNIVDPANSLQPTERRTAAMAHCEQMLMDINWRIYYLHHYDTMTVSPLIVHWYFIPLISSFL